MRPLEKEGLFYMGESELLPGNYSLVQITGAKIETVTELKTGPPIWLVLIPFLALSGKALKTLLSQSRK